jgi:Kef-type K+ transport system membrane component KefB
MEIFLEFTSIVLLATLLSIVMKVLKQPLVIGYIMTGIFIGPNFLGLLHTKDYIELFSKIGITILLFIVGLNLSPKVIKEVGKVSVFGGLGQIILTAIWGYIASVFLGMPQVHAVYIAVALTFSSTIIILKILSDKGELQKLHGKVSVGLLLIQDLVAIGLLIVVSSFGNEGGAAFSTVLALLLLKTVLMFGLLYFVSNFIFSRTMHFLAESQELLFLFSIAWGLGLACIFYLLGLSVEVGALVAGVSLSITPFADGIASRLKPLRDFFIVLFFILLGSEMVLSTIPNILLPAIVLSFFVLIGKPLIVFLLMNLLGYKTRTAFETGISLAQVSEFSLILAALGLQAGHINQEVLSLITLVALVTIAGSSYMMLYSDVVYQMIESVLKKLEIKENTKEANMDGNTHDLVLFGYDNVGRDFIHAFSKLEKKYVVVDINPELIKELLQINVPFKYGDVEDIEFLQELNLKTIKLCVSTVPTFKANALLIKKIREVNSKAIVIVRCHEIREAKELYELGASYVVMPHYLGAKYASNMISKHGLDNKGFEEEREKHLLHVNKYAS